MSLRILESSAVIIGDYRYELLRIWDKKLHRLVVGMLNPSTADADANDPTITFLMDWAFLNGFGGLQVVNENAFRSSSPLRMMLEDDPRGPKNMFYLGKALRYASNTSGVALAAWGNGSDGKRFTAFAELYEVRLICLGTTQSGAPKHPMARGVHKIPKNQPAITWRPPL